MARVRKLGTHFDSVKEEEEEIKRQAAFTSEVVYVPVTYHVRGGSRGGCGCILLLLLFLFRREFLVEFGVGAVGGEGHVRVWSYYSREIVYTSHDEFGGTPIPGSM